MSVYPKATTHLSGTVLAARDLRRAKTTNGRGNMRFTLLAIMAITAPLSAQSRMPDSLVNTKVFPMETPVREVVNQMRNMTRALGVRCTYCHVGEESMPIWDYDFASDEKPTKLKARVMMEMVNSINDEHLEKLSDLDAQGITVTCQTCHRGVAVPIPLQDLLIRTYNDSGLAVMNSTYEELRERYFGQASYDFGESALALAANYIQQRGVMADAIATRLKNAELFPSSTFAQTAIGEVLLAAGDSARAVPYYRKALEFDPGNRVAQRRIAALEGGN